MKNDTDSEFLVLMNDELPTYLPIAPWRWHCESDQRDVVTFSKYCNCDSYVVAI